MKITTGLPLPMPTYAAVPPHELFRREDAMICGDLKSAYNFMQAPVCSGDTPICTFSNSMQGCCNEAGTCSFYTTCNGLHATETYSTSGYLSCQNIATPYCVKYNFADQQNGATYVGYACGTYSPESATVYGVVGSSAVTTTPTSGSSTMTSSPTAGSAAATSTPSDGPMAETVHHGLSKAAIAGIAVAVIAVFVAALIVLLCCLKKRKKRRLTPPKPSVPFVQQNVLWSSPPQSRTMVS